MCPAMNNHASCEIHAVICFLHAKNVSAAEILHELCTVYGQNVLSEDTTVVYNVQRWANRCSQ
jgi:hypothetical protein